MAFKSHELVIDSMTGGANQQGGEPGSLAALFSNLAVPAGLFYAQQTLPIGQDNPVRSNASKTSVIPTSLFDTLTKLAETKPKETKKPKETTKPKETKKRKNTHSKDTHSKDTQNKKQRKTRKV